MADVGSTPTLRRPPQRGPGTGPLDTGGSQPYRPPAQEPNPFGPGWSHQPAHEPNPFAAPPSPSQQPGGNAQALMSAAIGSSTKNLPPGSTGGHNVGGGGTKTLPPGSTGGYGYGAPPTPAAAPPPTAPSGGPMRGGGPTVEPTHPTVTTPGAPPGVPDTTFNVPLVPSDEAAKAKAIADYGDVSANEMAAIQAAAMGYGDPSLMAQWGLTPSANPNSALALAALRAQQQTQTAEANRERAGTFFSSLMGQDLGNIGNSQQRAQLAGYMKYQNALAAFNRAMTAAQQARDLTINAANADERQNALNTLPTPQGTGSGGFEGGGNQNITSKVPTKPPSGTPGTGKGGSKGKTVKPPKPVKSKGLKFSKSHATLPKGGKVGGVKKAARVPGKRK